MRLLLAAVLALGFTGLAKAEVACLLIADARSGAIVHGEGDGCDEAIGPTSSAGFPGGCGNFSSRAWGELDPGLRRDDIGGVDG